MRLIQRGKQEISLHICRGRRAESGANPTRACPARLHAMRRISRLKLEHSSTLTHVQGIKQKKQSNKLQIYINCPSAQDAIRINQARASTGRTKPDIASRLSGVPKAAA